MSTRRHIKETGFEWPFLVDEDRSVYRSYGMTRAGFWDIWGPKTWLAYLQQFAKGRFLKRSAGDIYQRGGDVLIDSHGIIQLHHVGQGPGDRPSVESILRVVDQG